MREDNTRCPCDFIAEHKCEIFILSIAGLLYYYLKREEPGINIFPCNECDRVYKSAKTLKRHKLKHEQSKKHYFNPYEHFNMTT